VCQPTSAAGNRRWRRPSSGPSPRIWSSWWSGCTAPGQTRLRWRARAAVLGRLAPYFERPLEVSAHAGGVQRANARRGSELRGKSVQPTRAKGAEIAPLKPASPALESCPQRRGVCTGAYVGTKFLLDFQVLLLNRAGRSQAHKWAGSNKETGTTENRRSLDLRNLGPGLSLPPCEGTFASDQPLFTVRRFRENSGARPRPDATGRSGSAGAEE
jgi:hypothetical protein